jgi:hypothetical protein
MEYLQYKSLARCAEKLSRRAHKRVVETQAVEKGGPTTIRQPWVRLYTYFEIKSEQTLSLGMEEMCVEGDGGVPDVGSVVAVPRLSCETRLFITFRFHVWSYSIYAI